MADNKPSMGGVLEYIKSRKDSATGGSQAGEAPAASSPPKQDDAPGGDGSGLPFGQDEDDENVICEKCGHANMKKKESERVERSQGNFDTKEP